MSADIRARLAAQEVVLKIIARQLLERGLLGGNAVAGDLDGVARQLGPGQGRRVVDVADRRTGELLRAWADLGDLADRARDAGDDGAMRRFVELLEGYVFALRAPDG